MTTNEILESLGVAQAKIEEAKKKLKAEFVPFIRPFFEALFIEYPKLATIDGGVRVHGYTPGFNDGDPCVHTQGTNLGDIDDVSYADYKRDFAPAESKIDRLETVLHEAFGTNWEITVTQADGKVAVSEPEEYDCGY